MRNDVVPPPCPPLANVVLGAVRETPPISRSTGTNLFINFDMIHTHFPSC